MGSAGTPSLRHRGYDQHGWPGGGAGHDRPGPEYDSPGHQALRPPAGPSFGDLQRQVHLLENLPTAPIRPTRVNVDELLGTEQLPAPAKRAAAPKEEKPAAPAPPRQRQVGIADQIAIRSYVLGKELGKN